MRAPEGARESPPRRRPGRAFLAYWLPVGAYILLIFGLSSLHGDATPIFFPSIPHMDKLEHLLEYSLLGLLLGRALRNTVRGRRSGLLASALTVTLGAVVAAADELYQGRVEGRQSDLLDWATDVLALGLAVFLTQVVHLRPLGGTKERAGAAVPPRSDSGEGGDMGEEAT